MPMKAYVSFADWKKDQSPKHLLVGSGQYVRHVKVRTARDIDPAAFAALIAQTLA
jgi:hypothetical protein